MQALAASCEELRARTGNPPLRGGWKSLILHVSTSALHTSIARSGRSVQSSLRIIYTSKYLLNWFLFAYKLYKHAKMQILIAQTSQEIKQRNRMTVCFEIFALLFSRGSCAVLFHAYVSVLALIFIIFLYYVNQLLSYGNGINFVKQRSQKRLCRS